MMDFGKFKRPGRFVYATNNLNEGLWFKIKIMALVIKNGQMEEFFKEN